MTIVEGKSVLSDIPVGCVVRIGSHISRFMTRGLVFRTKYGTDEEDRVPNRNQLALHYKHVEISITSNCHKVWRPN